MPNRKSHVWLPVLAFGVLLVAGGSVWFLLGSGSDQSRDLAPRSTDRVVAESPEKVESGLIPTRSENVVDSSWVPPRGPSDEYRAALGGVRGRVLEADRQPAVDLMVSVLELQTSQFLREPEVLLAEADDGPSLEVAQATTDEEGRFELQGLEPRAFHFLALDFHGPRATARILDHTPGPGEWVDVGDIVLEPFITFVGRVVDEHGEPVPGARVRGTNLPMAQLVASLGVLDLRSEAAVFVEEPEFARGTSDREPNRVMFDVPRLFWKFEKLLVAFSQTPTTFTDEDGAYRLEGVPAGMVTVTADKRGYLGSARPPMPSGKRKERKVPDLVLAEGETLRGTVTLGRELLAPGVEVRAGIVPLAVAGFDVNACLLQPAGKTDARGEFELGGLPRGPRAVVATRKSSVQPWSLHGPFDVGGTLNIELGGSEDLRVLTLGADGEPLDRVEFFLRADNPLDAAPGAIRSLLAPPLERLRAVEREDEGVWRVRELDPGRYRLLGRAEEMALVEAEIEVQEGETAEVTLQFEPGHAVDVTVTDVGEEPLSYAFVSISRRGAFEDPIDRARTDAHGRSQVSGMTAGDYTLYVQHPSHATVTLDVTVPCEELLVSLAEGGHLRGRVHHGGEPPGEPRMLLLAPQGEFHPGVSPHFAVTTPDGDFFVPNLDPGEYAWQVRDRLVGAGTMALFLTMRDDPMAEGQTTIAVGEITELDVNLDDDALPSGTITGEVYLNGAVAQGVNVSWVGPTTRSGETDENGWFDLGVVAAGEGHVEVRNSGGGMFAAMSQLDRQDHELAVGQHLHLRFDLYTASVRGSVRLENSFLPGAPGAFVTLVRNGRPQQFTLANPLTGGFEFNDVTRGNYQLRARKQGCVEWKMDVDVQTDQFHEIVLVPALACTGTVVLPEGTVLERSRGASQPGQSGGAGRTFLRFERADGSDGSRQFARLDPETLEFRWDSAAPGTYRALLQNGEQTLASDEFTLGGSGSNHLLLVMSETDE